MISKSPVNDISLDLKLDYAVESPTKKASIFAEPVMKYVL
jgi:hypothetical protein